MDDDKYISYYYYFNFKLQIEFAAAFNHFHYYSIILYNENTI